MRLTCALILLSTGISSTATNDHLVPRSKSFTEYRQLVRSRLGVTPFDCGRIVLIPDLGPEAAVAVYTSEAFRTGLGELGYVEGRTLVMEWRFADGNARVNLKHDSGGGNQSYDRIPRGRSSGRWPTLRMPRPRPGSPI